MGGELEEVIQIRGGEVMGNEGTGVRVSKWK